MGMNSLEMSEHDFSIERMTVRKLGVVYDRVGHGLLVVADELVSAARADLLERHASMLRGASTCTR